ncbi:hypothetical protein AYL99_04905 [Fonsecaea erecta]|uniref:Major facilitator superfamily (MFS) profile domain-containing protein n=1 Tax=Fonsecaea erecta TaxID=1367422 RepID=A0A178ZL16_9EURO|nr:hypothetical protein AYL99_04905 [Fonsecaea erecta]OAP59903.1 hypothetical protein AYL99_04905 [Fonsecaea erecta]
MASSKSNESSLEQVYDLKGETVPVTLAVEDELSSGSNSIADDKTFLRVQGEENYVPIERWEGRHRFDPSFEWEPAEEKRIVRKIDLKICSWHFIPDTILYLSYYYKGRELPARLAWFWTAYQATSIVGAFLAAAILNMRGINGLAGWAWLFALEGTLTGLIGIATYFYLPPSPYQTASWFRGKKGWFTEREEKIIANRILRDDPSKADMHNRQAVTPKLLFYALCDWEMWPIYAIGLTFLIPNYPVTSYLSLILKQSFGRFEVNMLTIPSYVLFIINLLVFTWLSEKTNQRFLVALLSQIWCMPLLIASELLPGEASRWVKYTLATLLVGTPYVHAIHVAITSRNAGSVRTRTVASALYNMFVQASNIIGSNIFRTDDAPQYRRGYKVLIGICAYNIVLFLLAKWFYIWRNKVRDRKWNSMTEDEQRHYLATTTDKGNKMLTFRFAH